MFALIDCNNFYASCERVFQPHLQNKPLMVLSNNDGCIIARSQEVKDLGVPMGAPYFEYEHLVKKHNIHVFSANFSLYGDLSNRIMSILSDFSPEVEVYSIDEAFLNLEGCPQNLEKYGTRIRQTILKHTGIPTSVGIAHTKTLSKVATETAKQNEKLNGVSILTKENTLNKTLEKTEVSDVWGIGKRYTKFLNRHGIYNALQLKHSPDKWIQKHLTIQGLRTVHELRGIPCIPLETHYTKHKTILSSRSFSSPVTSLQSLKEAIATYTSRAAEKLRADQSIASYLRVYIRTNIHNPKEPQYKNGKIKQLPYPTADTSDLVKNAHSILKELYKPNFRYKKAGVMLSGLSPNSHKQQNLFSQDYYSVKKETLMKTMDTINYIWGRNTIHLAAEGTQKEWYMNQNRKSPRYTTNWNELPIIPLQ